MLTIADGLGASDCETIRDAWLAQPVNAWSSLAYVIVGLAVVAFAFRQRADLSASIVYGLSVAAIGVGSVLFHGPQPAGSQLLHDLPILLTVVFIVAVDIALIDARLRWQPLFIGGALAATLLSVVNQMAGAAATAVAVAVAVALEATVYRRRLRDADVRRQRRLYGVIVAVAIVAGTVYALGRTGSPACDPDGELQLHGLWHVVSAVVFGLWWWLAFGVARDPNTSREPRVSN